MKAISWKINDILKASGAEFLCGDANLSFSGISIDSRTITPGDLFIAIKGENHDGHKFAGDVVKKGVKGLLLERKEISGLPWKEWEKSGVFCAALEDTQQAMGKLAAYNLARSSASVIAITGSNGKTTTRAMTSSVVGQRFKTLSTRGNFNNEIGLPLTLFNLAQDHEWAVLEMGMNHAGEIQRLARICRPDIGIITNIGPAHIGELGSMEAIMSAKGELLQEMSSRGTAILNADDPLCMKLAEKTSNPLCFFGLSPEALIRASSIKQEGTYTEFSLELPGENVHVRLNVPGRFMIYNALAAASAGRILKLSAHEIKTGLENFTPVQGRMNIIETNNGIHLIDDTYNANPESMIAAINTLKSLKGKNRGIIAAGDMLELGEHSEYLHRNIGALAAESGISKLYVTGRFSDHAAAGAMDKGMNAGDIFKGTHEEIAKSLKEILKPGDWVLIKGSRGIKMEKIVSLIINN